MLEDWLLFITIGLGLSFLTALFYLILSAVWPYEGVPSKVQKEEVFEDPFIEEDNDGY